MLSQYIESYLTSRVYARWFRPTLEVSDRPDCWFYPRRFARACVCTVMARNSYVLSFPHIHTYIIYTYSSPLRESTHRATLPSKNMSFFSSPYRATLYTIYYYTKKLVWCTPRWSEKMNAAGEKPIYTHNSAAFLSIRPPRTLYFYKAYTIYLKASPLAHHIIIVTSTQRPSSSPN